MPTTSRRATRSRRPSRSRSGSATAPWRHGASISSGSTRLKLGDLDGAREHLRAGLRLFDDAGDVAGVTLEFDGLSALAAAEGDLPRAARLQGLARRIQAASGTGLAGVVDEAFEQATRPNAANRLEPSELERYRAEGATLALEDAVRYALGGVAWEELAP